MSKVKSNYRSMLRACLSLFRIKTAEGFQYRAAGLAGATISIFWALIEITVITVFYRYSSNTRVALQTGMSLSQAVTYVWLAQAFVMMQPMNIDSEILNKITRGDVAIEMCRPLDLYFHWFAKTAASRLTPLFWRGSVTVIAGLLMPTSIRLGAPVSFEGFIFMLLSTFSAFLLCTAYAMFVIAIRLNISAGEGPMYIMMLIGGVLSGAYLPLQLWPEFMKKFLLYQPFAGYLDIPLRLYIGSLSTDSAAFAICIQLLWVGIFVAAGKLIMSRRLRNIIVQGG